VDGCHDDGVLRPRGAGEPDAADLVVFVEQLRDGRHRSRLAEDLEPDHRPSLTRQAVDPDYPVCTTQWSSATRRYLRRNADLL
jgi:hypothetical protein